jgi:hypothetical protein
MNNFEEIKKANPNLNIININNEKFRDYGVVYDNYDLTEINEYMDNVLIPENSVYTPKNPDIEKMTIISQLSADVFGGMKLSAGECMGHCDAFSAIEFHQGSEVNITFTDLIMVLGKRRDLRNYEYNAEENAEIFFIPKGTVFEMFSDTLHYSPIDVDSSGFKALVVVLNGTNEVLLSSVKSSNKMLVKQNKFQLAHQSRKDKVKAGVLPGVKGNLIQVKPMN